MIFHGVFSAWSDALVYDKRPVGFVKLWDSSEFVTIFFVLVSAGSGFQGAEDQHVTPVAVHLHGWFQLPCEEEKEVLEFCTAEDSSPTDYCPPCPSLNLSSCLRFFLSCFFVFED